MEIQNSGDHRQPCEFLLPRQSVSSSHTRPAVMIYGDMNYLRSSDKRQHLWHGLFYHSCCKSLFSTMQGLHAKPLRKQRHVQDPLHLGPSD